MDNFLPRTLRRRLEELERKVGTKQFFPYSAQLLYWLSEDPQFGPLAAAAAAEYKELLFVFNRRLQANLQEGAWLLERLEQRFPETRSEGGWVSGQGLPLMTYLHSLHRARDIVEGRDLMSQAQPLEAPTFAEDRTPAGALARALWTSITKPIEATGDLLQNPEVERLFLDIDYLVSKQHALIIEMHVRVPALPGNSLSVLERYRRALVIQPERYASLDERSAAFFRISPQLTSEAAAVQRDAQAEVEPQEGMHRRVLQLWEALFHDLADRLERQPVLRTAPLLEAPRVLLLTANTPEEPLWVEQEVKAIKEALWGSAHRDGVLLLHHPAAAGQEFMPQLERERPQALHFSGHGEEAGLYFVDEQGEAELQGRSLIVETLRLARGLRLAVFMACDSAGLAQEATRHLDAAIGMAEKVPDSDAPIFSAALYQALSNGRHLQDAFDMACLAVCLGGGADDIPVLCTREGVDAADFRLR